jgi:hypothetical protein
MTIILYDVPAHETFTAEAGQTVFHFDFKFYENQDLDVWKNGVPQILTTDYTVQGAALDEGMQITLTSGATLGDTIKVVRSVPYERTADYPLTGPFRVESLNIEQARQVMMIQQLHDILMDHESRIQGYVQEAPLDGLIYGRTVDGSGTAGMWTPVAEGAIGATIYYGDNPPAVPRLGQLFYETDSGALFIYIFDGTSNQWVQVAAVGGG